MIRYIEPAEVNITELAQELEAAGIPAEGLALIDGDLVIQHFPDPDQRLPPEAAPVVTAHLEKHDPVKKQAMTTFETQEDAERIAIIRERASTDPAFAALADLTLGKQGVTS